MFVLVFFAFLAGIVTLLSPCILPVLPIILTGVVGRGRAKPWGIIAGFVTSFTFFTLSLSALVRYSGISADALRSASMVLLALFGLFLCLPALQVFFEVFAARFLPQQGPSNKGQGFWSGAVIGMSLGLIWTPCVGPIMAAVITLAASSAVNVSAVLITFAYALGTSVPMLAIMFGGRKLLDRIPWIKEHAAAVQRGFGVIMLLVAFSLWMGYDRKLESWVLTRFPGYGSGLTSLEENSRVKAALTAFDQNGKKKVLVKGAPQVKDVEYPQAPEIIAGGAWFNTEPLSLQQLRGKVVLVDFWTYTCINCIRTLPALEAWHERYAGQGLVIIGVHTPEFPFEAIPENVAKAIKAFGVKYPVVQDDRYATWNAYGNHYWPAKYFVDKQGRVRATHFGEGGEQESEALIRKLLQEQGVDPGEHARKHEYDVQAATPETYLGRDRTERFYSPQGLSLGLSGYSLPAALAVNGYAYEGSWLVAADHSSPAPGARLDLHFQAREVYVVMRPEGHGSAVIQVLMDGQPVGIAEQGRDVHDGKVLLDNDRLYQLLSLKKEGEHTLTLKFSNGNVGLFALTFG